MIKSSFSAFVFAIFALSAPDVYAAHQSQTILRLTSGMIQTLPAVVAEEYKIFTPGVKEPFVVKKAGLLYDKRNPLPMLLTAGANYAFFKGGVMATVDEVGGLLYKGKVPFEPAESGLGGVFFLNKGTSEVIAVDSAGFYNSTGVIASNVRLMGGNFYIEDQLSGSARTSVLTTIKHMGTEPGNPLGMVTKKEGWDFSDAIIAGGNWFEKVDGSIVGIASETGYFTESQKVESRPKKIGGNYFISDDGVLYTVDSAGKVKKQMPIIGEMSAYGYSYMIADDGYFIFVDGDGTPHTQLVRVSTTGIKAELVSKISGSLDTHQNFTQAIQ